MVWSLEPVLHVTCPSEAWIWHFELLKLWWCDGNRYHNAIHIFCFSTDRNMNPVYILKLILVSSHRVSGLIFKSYSSWSLSRCQTKPAALTPVATGYLQRCVEALIIQAQFQLDNSNEWKVFEQRSLSGSKMLIHHKRLTVRPWLTAISVLYPSYH